MPERRHLDHLPEYLTRSQVATFAQVSVRTVDRHIRAGRLRAHRTNGHVRLHRDDVATWLAGLVIVLLTALALIAGCMAHRLRTHAGNARLDARQEAALDRRQLAGKVHAG